MNDLLEALVPRVYHFALRLAGDQHLAEDLTQEALLRAWRERAHLRDRQALRIWLFRITANLWRDWLRRGRSPVARAERLPALDQVEAAGRYDRPELAAAERDDVRQALAALDALPERQREVLYLHACEELSLAEIAEVLATNSGAVKSNLSLARKRMREMLPELFHDLFPSGSLDKLP